MFTFLKIIFIASFLTLLLLNNITSSAQETDSIECLEGEIINSCICPQSQAIYNISIESKETICGCPKPKIVEIVDDISYCKVKTYSENAPAETLDAPAQTSGGGVISIQNSSISSSLAQFSSSSVDLVTSISNQKYEISDPYICGGNFTGRTNNPKAVSVNYVLFNTMTGAKSYEFSTAVKNDRTFELVIDYSKVIPYKYNVVYYGVGANGEPENPGNSYLANIGNNCAVFNTVTPGGEAVQIPVMVIEREQSVQAKGASTIRTGGESNSFVILSLVFILSIFVCTGKPIWD
jgi:hypothetical protein